MELGEGGGIADKRTKAWRQVECGTFWQLKIWTGRSMGEDGLELKVGGEGDRV